MGSPRFLPTNDIGCGLDKQQLPSEVTWTGRCDLWKFSWKEGRSSGRKIRRGVVEDLERCRFEVFGIRVKVIC